MFHFIKVIYLITRISKISDSFLLTLYLLHILLILDIKLKTKILHFNNYKISHKILHLSITLKTNNQIQVAILVQHQF